MADQDTDTNTGAGVPASEQLAELNEASAKMLAAAEGLQNLAAAIGAYRNKLMESGMGGDAADHAALDMNRMLLRRIERQQEPQESQ